MASKRGRMQGQLIARGPGKWLVRVCVGQLAGKWKYASKTVHGTHSEARTALREELEKKDKGTLQTNTKQTVQQFLEGWLDRKTWKRATTERDYRARLAQDVFPKLGHLPLHKLTVEDIEHLYKDLGQRLSPATVQHTHQVLHAALAHAVRRGQLVKNPMDLLEDTPTTKPQEPKVLTPEQIKLVLERSKADSLHALWALQLGTGLRPGEALALRWDDLVVDGETTSVVVRRTLIWDGHKWDFKEAEAKTDGSLRKIPLPATVVTALDVHRKRQVEAALLTGVRTDLIFSTKHGTPIDQATARRHWKRLLKQLQLPDVRWYATRHSHATALLTSGVPLPFVANRLGHSNIGTTQRHYLRYLPATQQACVDAFDKMVASGQKG